jgi:hypothetical protein
MLRTIKRVFPLALLAAGLQPCLAFVLIGPYEPYQVPTIGYNLATDVGAPKNFGEEYRRNTPVMYYSCDASFRNYFGDAGVSAIDGAFNVYSDLGPVSAFSPDLSEVPFKMSRKNYRAESLFLLDLKATTMQLIIETLGLAEPTRYTWSLHDRFLQPGTTCPFGEVYLVIKRNFDPPYGTSLDQLKPTSYVNGVLLSYSIVEFCTGPNPLAYCLPFPVDPTTQVDDIDTAVADYFGFGAAFTAFSYSPFGLFYNGLTFDDVGGLRYLYRTNNVNFESSGPDSFVHVTNGTPTLLITSNLTLLASQALTNDAPTLQGLYPNLVILSTSNFFSNVYTTNFTAYFTNFPWDPIGTAPHIAFVTNVTSSVATLFSHLFGNVLQVVPAGSASGWTLVPLLTPPPPTSRTIVTLQTTTVAVSNNPWAPVGSTQVLTNTTSVTYQTNGVVGDYVILPTNWCEVSIISSQLTNVTSFTNPVVTATNFFGATNQAGTLLAFTQNLIGYFTNHYFIVYPITCNNSNVALYQGIDKFTFIRRDFDSLTGRYFQPLTNWYTLNMVTNNTVIKQRVHRIVTRPDILITAADLAAGPDQPPATPAVRRSIGANTGYNTNFENLYLAGPGTIESGNAPGLPGGNGPLPGTQFIYNNVGPIFINFGLVDTNAFLEEQDHIPIFVWGSFDGTTNVPTIYPNDVSVTMLENEMLVQVSPPILPDGSVNVDYSAELLVQSGTPGIQGPFTWTLAPSSPGLPPGLRLQTDGFNSGVISGTPYQDGFFDFVVRVIDAFGNPIDRSMSIRILPPPQ